MRRSKRLGGFGVIVMSNNRFISPEPLPSRETMGVVAFPPPQTPLHRDMT